jgi:hypothetical protein
MPSVYGQRQKDNNFLVDGVENRDPNLLGVAIYPPPEAIAEMRVDSGVGSSAYGHVSGATIDVVTKSRGAQWHGDGWEYLRNNVLDARSFFTPTIGAYRWNQFGAAIGGPAVIPHLPRKERGWYVFGYYEGVRVNGAANYTGFVPTPANYTGDLSNSTTTIYDPFSTAAGPKGTNVRQPFPGNIIPASRLNAQALKLRRPSSPPPISPRALFRERTTSTPAAPRTPPTSGAPGPTTNSASAISSSSATAAPIIRLAASLIPPSSRGPRTAC